MSQSKLTVFFWNRDPYFESLSYVSDGLVSSGRNLGAKAIALLWQVHRVVCCSAHDCALKKVCVARLQGLPIVKGPFCRTLELQGGANIESYMIISKQMQNGWWITFPRESEFFPLSDRKNWAHCDFWNIKLWEVVFQIDRGEGRGMHDSCLGRGDYWRGSQPWMALRSRIMKHELTGDGINLKHLNMV